MRSLLVLTAAALGCCAAWANTATAAPASAVFDCSTAFICPKTYMPVCDQEGNVYSNVCMMKSESCEDGKERFETPCPVKKGKKEAGEQQQPGMDGVDEWENEEEALVAPMNTRSSPNAPHDREGGDNSDEDGTGNKCSEKCYKIYQPVCGADGYKYSNLCLLEVQGCKTGKPIETVNCSRKSEWNLRTEEDVFGERED